MTENEIFEKIATLIEKNFGITKDKVTNEMDFQADLDADSIDIVEFVLELEEIFGSEISDEDAQELTTVGKAVAYITQHQ